MELKFDTIGKLKNIAMIEKLEGERGMLNQTKIDLEEKLTHEFLSEIEIKDLYERIKTIVMNPIAIREMGNKELKMMLISVLFGGKIYYSKKLGFQTNENQALFRASPIYLYRLFDVWGHSLVPFGTYADIFETIQRKNNFNRMIDVVNLYINDITPNKESILSNLSDREKALYEL